MNIAVYTNILTPYRTYFYNTMYQECKAQGDNFYVILMADTEPNRNWKYEEYKTEYTILLNHKTLSIGETYIHFNNNLEKVLKELDLDVLVCAGSYLCPGVWKSLSLRKKFGYKTYFWSESHLNEERNYSGINVKIREFIRKAIYKKFDGFWYAGELSRQFITTYCNPSADMVFLPNLVEEEKYKLAANISEEEREVLRKKYNVAKENTVLICPARLSPVKGIDKFIPILAKVKNKSKVTFLVAGDGELKDKLASMADEEKIDVRLLGFQNQDSIIELYSIADIFVLPSLSDPNPLTCIEALWAGLPLFISEHCGNYPEVVSQGNNGYVFSYCDTNNAVSRLNALIDSDKEWFLNAKRVSNQLSYDKFNSKNTVKRVIEYYHI